MSETVTELVTKSWFLSGIVPKTNATVTGSELTEGIELLNALLAFKTAGQRGIPYFREYEFPAVVNDGEYFVENLIFAETLTFNIGEIRYRTYPTGRREYFGSDRAENISSLPFQWHWERVLNGSNVYLYFKPDQNYPIKIWGKFSFDSVERNQDLSLTFDGFYREYLRYELAKMMCDDNDINFSSGKMKTLETYRSKIIDISPMDMSMQKFSTLQVNNGPNWGSINLSNGWFPP